MRSYITKPNIITKKDILNKNFILSPARFQYVGLQGDFDYLKNLIKISKETVNIRQNKGVYKYIEIGDINTNTGSIDYKNVLSYDISSNSVFRIQKDDILISTVRTYLGGIGLVKNNDNNLVSTKALIVLRELKRDISKFYLFGILRSTFFIEQTNAILNASMYPRMEKDNFEELKVPFPTRKNNKNTKSIEKLVSLIVQNIIDKEQQIKVKNKKIDEMIEQELKQNQKSKKFKYAYPLISEIKKQGRLDTGIYEQDFKGRDFLIRNYKDGYFSISYKNIKTGRTPKDYYYPASKVNEKVCFWLTPKSIKKREFLSQQYIYTKKETNLIDGDLIFTGIGTGSQGHLLFYDKVNLGKTYINQNTYAISLRSSLENRLFVLCFLSSKFLKSVIQNYTSKGSVPAIYPRDIAKLIFPNFPASKQKQIAQEYYNPQGRNESLNLDNYLQKEKDRNKKLGIFQLNMDIFKLREQLEDLVDKIVRELPIKISFEY